MKTKRYVPNLREMQSLAERNYAALAGLLSAVPQVGDTRAIAVGNQLVFLLEITAVAKYTTELTIRQTKPSLPEYLHASFSVRLYHDARMAEMIASQGLDRFAAVYEQPNKAMLHKDEKRQINKFLADWLRLCFNKGRWQDVSSQATDTTLQLQVKNNNDRL